MLSYYASLFRALRIDNADSANSQSNTTAVMDEELDKTAATVHQPQTMASKRKQLRRNKYKDCLTCTRTLDLSQYPHLPADASCIHERDTCRKCWNLWIESQLESKPLNQISCAQCNNFLTAKDVKQIGGPRLHKRFIDTELKLALSAEPDFRWCLAPSCKSGQIHTEGDIFRCVACDSKACVQCNALWHEGETCAQHQARVAAQPSEEEQSARYLENKAKQCPGCKRNVQKHGGCDHITCTMCGHEFCWLCLAAQTEIRRLGNTAHAEKCKYHSNNLAIAWPFSAYMID